MHHLHPLADFLNQNHNCVPRFVSEVGAASAFFGGQAGVALDRGIPIQCEGGWLLDRVILETV